MNLSSTHSPLLDKEGLFIALIERIHPDIPNYEILVEELKKFDSGDTGELYIRELLMQEFGPALIHFPNYKLYGNEIDLLSVTDNACFLFEIKNIKGRVHIMDDPRQLIRTTEDGKIDVFKNPMSQLELNLYKLQRLFALNNISIPIFTALVFAFHNAYIVNDVRQFPIVIGRDVCRFVYNSCQVKTPRDNSVVKLLEQNRENQYYLPKLAKFKLDTSSLRTGVFCPKCGNLPMKRIPHKWHCPRCNYIDRYAHLTALHDYYELISNKMTNVQCRHFLHLRNRHEAKRILTSISVAQSGHNRNRTYTIKY